MQTDRWLTPNVKPPTKFLVRRLLIPADYNYISIVNGALLDLTYASNFEAYGDATPDECAKAFSDMYAEYVKPVKDAPGWEDDDDVDGGSGQPWYNDLADWIIKGFLVISGFPQAAIIYSTTVPKIRIAIQKHDLGALFRVLLNNLEMYTGDSYDALKQLSGFTLDLEGFAAAHSLGAGPWTLRIEHMGAGASLPPGQDGELRVVRKKWTDEMPLQFRQTDPCLLEYSEDSGGNWQTAADLSLCAGSGGVPTGAMFPLATSTIPTGYLLCDGSLISRTTYAALFAVIGTTWGSGDGSTTFGLPDTLGRAVIGSGAGSGLSNRTIADKSGEETHVLSTGEMPSHVHTIYPNGAGGTRYYPQLAGSDGSGTPNNAVTSFPTGSGLAHNNMQPFVAAPYIIKT